jgi:hypothetical protein
LSCDRSPCSPNDIGVAAENDFEAVRVNYFNPNEVRERENVWRPPDMITITPQPLQDRAFNADYRTVEYDQLNFAHALTRSVHVVEFEGEKYVYKFMVRYSNQDTFEREFQHYLHVRGCAGVAELVAVVSQQGRIRGLLLSFIDGQNLIDEILGQDHLRDIICQILTIAAGLERAGFYHTDLKCSNIVRRHSNGKIFFIDLGGGLTEGWYKPGLEFKIMHQMIDARNALYILGKTLWELWTSDIPEGTLPNSIPESARKVIVNCCVSEKYNSIEEVRIEYCG